MKIFRLGQNLALGCGLIISMVCLIGLISIWMIHGLKMHITAVSMEAIPASQKSQSIITNLIRSEIHRRAFIYNAKRDQYTECVSFLESAKNQLQKRAKQQKQEESISRINKDLGKYEETIAAIETIHQKRDMVLKELDQASSQFLDNSQLCLKQQVESLETEMAAGLNYNRLSERLKTISRIYKLIEIGNQLSIAFYKTQTLKDDLYSKETLSQFDQIETIISDINSFARLKETLLCLSQMKTAIANYKSVISRFLRDFNQLMQIEFQGEKLLYDSVARLAPPKNGKGHPIETELQSAISHATTLMIWIIFSCILISGLFIIPIIIYRREMDQQFNHMCRYLDHIQRFDDSIQIPVTQDDSLRRLILQIQDMAHMCVQYGLSLKQLPIPIIQMNANKILTYINDAAALFAGVQVENAIGMKCSSIFKSENCQTDQCPCYLTLREDRDVSFESRVNTSSRKNIPIRYIGIPIRKNDSNTEVLICMIDQTVLYGVVDELRGIIHELMNSSEKLSNNSNEMTNSMSIMINQTDHLNQSADKISNHVDTVASSVDHTSISVANIASITNKMSETYKHLVQMVRKTSENVSDMARSGEEMSKKVSDVAAAIEETTASLGEVSKSTTKASDISREANEQTKGINTKMDSLVAASKQIGKVIAVIKDIADQTNMLALNAAIEAAGAGEAGKGFAVVAGEVKELAKQSADATDEIASQIENIQKSTHDAVEVIKKVNAIINEISEINNTIASAVMEQTSTAVTISKTIAETAHESRTVANRAADSSKLAQDITKSTAEASETADEVAKQLGKLAKESRDISISTSDVAKGMTEMSKNIQVISTSARETEKRSHKILQATEEVNQTANHVKDISHKFI